MVVGWESSGGTHRCASAGAGVDGTLSRITVQRPRQHGKYRVHVYLRAYDIIFVYYLFFPSLFSAARQWLLDFRIRFFGSLSRPSQPPLPTPLPTNTSTHTHALPVTRSFSLVPSTPVRRNATVSRSFFSLARTATTTGHAVDRVNIPPPWEPLAGRKNKVVLRRFFLSCYSIFLLLIFFFLITRFTHLPSNRFRLKILWFSFHLFVYFNRYTN